MGKRSNESSDDFANFKTADCLGALQGTLLRGLRRDDKDVFPLTANSYEAVSGVVLEVAQGVLFPLKYSRDQARKVWDKADERGWAKKLGSSVGLSTDVAQQQIDQLEAYALDGDQHLLGFKGKHAYFANPDSRLHEKTHQGLRFRIIEAGKWAAWPQFVEWQATQVLIDPADLGVELQRAFKSDEDIGFGPLALRASHWIAAPTSGLMDPASVTHVDVYVSSVLAPEEPSVYYKLQANNESFVTVKMPPSAAAPLEVHGVPRLVYRCIDLILSEDSMFRENQVRISALRNSDNSIMDAMVAKKQALQVFDILSRRGVGFGFLKSCFQKLCRLQANEIVLPTGDVVNGRIVVMVALGLCFSKKGDGFVPDLGMFVRGQTAALKRLAVTCGEDAFPQIALLRGLRYGKRNPATVLAALMGAGLCTMRIASYNVPDEIIISSMLVNCMALETPLVAQWRGPQRFKHQAPEEPIFTACNKTDMRMAARLLRVLRSFAGDMDLFDKMVSLVEEDQIKCFAADEAPCVKVPLLHAIDQHVYRGIAHASIDGADTFKQRFKDIFSHVTGFSPRLSRQQLDGASPQVRRTRRMESAIAIKVFDLTQSIEVPTTPKTIELQLDPGVLSGGVGTLGPFKVSTTAAENAADKGPTGAMTWSLLVVIGVETAVPIVINAWSAHVSDNARKPAVTATARRKALQKANDQTSLPFSSPMLPEYNRAVFADGTWSVTSPSKPPIAWSWSSPVKTTLEYTEFALQMRDSKPLTNPNSRIMPDLVDDDAMIKFLSEKIAIGAIWDQLDKALQEVVEQVGILAESIRINRRVMQVRMLSMLRQQYEQVAMPTPGLSGDLGADQLKAEEGDWIVYRGLLWISRAAPGALAPKQLPAFEVVDSRLLRFVEKKLVGLIVSEPNPAWKERFTTACDRLEASFNTPAVGGRSPYPYQQNLVQTMLDRDDAAVVKTPGHFVSLETGLGKSLIGVWYALSHLRTFGDAKRIVWITPNEVVTSAYTELATTWGLGRNVQIVTREAPSFGALINIVGFEWYSSGAHREILALKSLKAAPTSFVVFDEVHKMYSTNIRNSTMRSIAQASPKFACMTATPIAGPSAKLAIEWLKDTVGFPVNVNNQLVASAMMVAARYDLGIDEEDLIKVAQFQPEDAQRHLKALENGRDWNTAARIAREAAYPMLVQTAIDAAAADRTEHPNGGVLIFADSNDEADRIRTMITERVGPGKVGARDQTTEKDGNIEFVVTKKTDVAGYNFVRMGAILTGVYAGNAADRKQMRGRIKRLGQTRKRVTYITVYTQFSILELLHQRHNSVDMANASLEQLAEIFVAAS